MKYQKIGVYLSSKADLPESYTEAAQKVGELIGRTGRTLVYGGARKGLMETLAQSVKANGGRVFGMVPDIIVARGLESELDVTFRCVDLTDRKAMMNRESDVLVALPGGIGTLDEVFTVSAQQRNRHRTETGDIPQHRRLLEQTARSRRRFVPTGPGIGKARRTVSSG